MANETQHTQTPWKIEPCLDGSIFIEHKGKYIAHIESESGKATAEDTSNSRLIAASPDLLTACKKALIHFEHDNTNKGVQEDLRQAIAKAEGK